MNLSLSMQCFILFLMVGIAPCLIAQDDPCSVDHSQIRLIDPIQVKAVSKSKTVERSWDVMMAAKGSNMGCKWSAQSTFKQMLSVQGKLLHTELNLFDETHAAFNKDTQSVLSRDFVRSSIEIKKAKQDQVIGYQAGMVIQTQKFPQNRVKTDSSGQTRRAMIAGPASPMILYPALGLVFTWKPESKLNFALVGAKFTWYAIPKVAAETAEHLFAAEGGARFECAFTQALSKQVKWEHYSFMFWSIESKTAPELEIRNEVSVKAGPYLKAGLIARYTYLPVRWPPGAFTGELSLGFQLPESEP